MKTTKENVLLQISFCEILVQTNSFIFNVFQETIIANGGDSAIDFFGNGLLDGRNELDLSTSVSNSRHYKYISLILAAVALFFLSLCVAAFVTWRR